MTEVEFEFSPALELEEPLYLDSAVSRPPNRFRPERAADASSAPDRPLYLDTGAREPRRGRRGLALAVGCAATFLLAAVGGALLLEPPSFLRERRASMTARSEPADEKSAARAAPAEVGAAPQAEAAQPQGAPPSPSNAASAPSPATPQAAPDVAQASAAPAEAPPKAPPAAPTSKPGRPRAAAAKKQARHAGPAGVHRSRKASLDLDALAKSLN
jgi:hypothetical protein